MQYDKVKRLKMNRKVLKIWGRPLSHILRPPPIQAKIVEAAPPFLTHLSGTENVKNAGYESMEKYKINNAK